MGDWAKIWLRSIRNSYSSLVFSRDTWLGVAMLCVTFLYPLSGLCGLLCAIMVNGAAYLLSLDKFKMENGIYGFNAVILGLAMGALFPPNAMLLFLLVVASLMLLLWMVGWEALFAKNHLPYLVFPFLFTLWILLLMMQQREGASFVDCVLGDHVGILGWGDFSLSSISDHTIWLSLPEVVSEYFISLSSILFRQDVFVGLVMAVVLLCHSRIAFLFTWITHIAAFLLFKGLGLDSFHIPYACFGFNFTLAALALSCYLVPSKRAILYSLMLIPVLMVMVFASTRGLAYFNLPAFSSAFCWVTLLFLVVARQGNGRYEPRLSYLLERTPEENLYNNQTNERRFLWYHYHPFSLPFYGEWRVSQGVDGVYTHQGLWRDALDFVIELDGSQYKGRGDSLGDYYCYGKPVLAVADGEVVCVENSVEDNPVGVSNKRENWGNYVVIKHWDGCYSLLAHLKRDSFFCSVGQRVKRGDELALCGNSGLSPYPHLHFQFQASPVVGAPTIHCPFVNYLRKEDTMGHLVPCHFPLEGETVKNLSIRILGRHYQLYVGQTLSVSSNRYGEEIWYVGEAYGYRFIEDRKRGAKAWFALSEGLFEFQRYEGSEECGLYHFFLSNYKVITTDEEAWSLSEEMSPAIRRTGWVGYLLDFIAPFKSCVKSVFSTQWSAKECVMDVQIVTSIGGHEHRVTKYRTTFEGEGSLVVSGDSDFSMRIAF